MFFILILISPFCTNAYEMKTDYDIKTEKQEQYSKNAIDADELSYQKTPFNKFGRGLVNTATCWLEIPAEFFQVSQEKNPAAGVIIGFPKGLFMTALRCLTGLIDVVTFVIPPYDKPLMKPEYSLQHADEKFKEYMGGK